MEPEIIFPDGVVNAAVIVVVPVVANGVALPLEAITLLIEATDGFDELHVTDVVRI